MKVFFDTNVYIAEALLGDVAEQLVAATLRASWRVFVSGYVLDETERVMTEELGFSRRLATLTRRRMVRIAARVEPGSSRHIISYPRMPATIRFFEPLCKPAVISWFPTMRICSL